MAAKLAKALGLSQTKVEAALKANRPSGTSGQAPSGTAPAESGQASSTSTTTSS